MTGIGTCIPCMVGEHQDCNGAISSTGCKCADRDHQEDAS